jgi:hypothetical protein
VQHAEAWAQARAQAARDYRQAISYARRSAAKQFGLSALAAAILVPTMPLLVARVEGRTARVVFALIAFTPVYSLAISVMFLAQPRLRLALAVIGRRGLRLSHHDRTALIGMVLAAFPLAAIWTILFNLGLIR